MEKVFIGGFGWTGSGALIDCLADFSEVAYVRPDKEETSFLKGLYSLSYVYRSLLAGKDVPSVFIKDMLYYFRGYEGASLTVRPSREKPNVKRTEQLRYFLNDRIDEVVSWLEARLSLLEKDNAGIPSAKAEAFKSISKEFLNMIFSLSFEVQGLLGSDKRLAVVNNDPSAYSCDLFDFVGASSYTVVLRDYKDVYADLVRLSKCTCSSEDLNKFFKAHVSKINEFSVKLNALPADIVQKIHVIDFERFVSERSLRKDWVSSLGLDFSRRSGRYDADKSKRNIGIYRNYLDDDFDCSLLNELNRLKHSMLSSLVVDKKLKVSL